MKRRLHNSQFDNNLTQLFLILILSLTKIKEIYWEQMKTIKIDFFSVNKKNHF